MRLLRTLLFVLPAALLAACFPRGTTQEIIPRDSSAVLHPGDSVKVAVWRNPELSGGFLVAEDGTLRHPLYQAVHVAGIPIDSVSTRLGAFLAQFTTNPQFVIEPEFHVVVRGEVRTPALYTLPLEATLGGAIAAAGSDKSSRYECWSLTSVTSLSCAFSVGPPAAAIAPPSVASRGSVYRAGARTSPRTTT